MLYRSVPYDAVADFTHIRLVGTVPGVLRVNVDLPVRTFAVFVALAQARPGGVQYGSGGNGTINHLIGQLVMRATRIELVHVPYRGSAPATADVMGGQIPSQMESLPTTMGNIRGGRLRPIATSEDGRAVTLPDRRGARVRSGEGAFRPIGVRPGTLGPAAYTALVRSELTRWRAVIRACDISVD